MEETLRFYVTNYGKRVARIEINSEKILDLEVMEPSNIDSFMIFPSSKKIKHSDVISFLKSRISRRNTVSDFHDIYTKISKYNGNKLSDKVRIEFY
ncbi:hypothetical protein [Enterococcus sp. AZ180]|uniref:hypothetical protein n=1 Tax=Enterococcus sp. AZ180 TaxID=2774961 RepID=UPI003F27886D